MDRDPRKARKLRASWRQMEGARRHLYRVFDETRGDHSSLEVLRASETFDRAMNRYLEEKRAMEGP
ncbi:MAG: hypothetical protein ACOYD6_09405 [Limnochordia bacterium]|jgi:hypothetical protein